ncbi:MAG: NVEALA domain-containing protein [Tannerella sp.]|jgi:hypothetical protein|nr:NVEALA domain-containing protein [Tannerella sp.]
MELNYFFTNKQLRLNNMKKNVVEFTLLVAIVVAAGWNVSQNKSEAELSEFAIENIEALASGEGEVVVTCNQRPEGEGRCWTLDRISPLLVITCYRVDDPSSRCVEFW